MTLARFTLRWTPLSGQLTGSTSPCPPLPSTSDSPLIRVQENRGRHSNVTRRRDHQLDYIGAVHSVPPNDSAAASPARAQLLTLHRTSLQHGRRVHIAPEPAGRSGGLGIRHPRRCPGDRGPCRSSGAVCASAPSDCLQLWETQIGWRLTFRRISRCTQPADVPAGTSRAVRYASFMARTALCT